MMSVIQRLTSVRNGARRKCRRKSIVALDSTPSDRREVLARDVFHRDIESTAGLTQVVDLNNVRVGELSTHPCFVLKHADKGLFLGQVAQDLLDDDEAIESGESGLPRKPNFCHAAGGEFFEEREASKLLHGSDRRRIGLLGGGARHADYVGSLLPNASVRKLMTYEFVGIFLGFLWAMGLATSADAAGPTSAKALKALQSKLKVKPVAIVNPCAGSAKSCGNKGLSRVFAKLKNASKRASPVRILHFGDSHIAADYISGPIRARLQKKFGDGGRGFMHIDHRRKYGGRLLSRKEAPWKKLRHVELHKQELPFGFSAITLESKNARARLEYRLEPRDALVRLYYQQQVGGASVQLRVGKNKLSSFSTAGADKSSVAQFQLPKITKKSNRLTVQAKGAKAKLYGISFETGRPGVLFDPIGPVGADAKLYLQFGEASFRQHLQAYSPDLVIFMVGGNDAMKIRKGWTTLENVEKDHVQVIERIRRITPNADCMLWSPMDAGRRKGKRVVSQSKIAEVAQLQAAVAARMGCAYWDLYGLMGNKGAIARWSKAGVMNRDLIHPKRAAADLIGSMFSDAFLHAYNQE
jgi:lysophospholipase L1-like esterase